MKRREFLKATSLGIGASAIAAPAIAQSMPELKWRMPTSWPKSLDTIYGGADTFAKAVGEATDGKCVRASVNGVERLRPTGRHSPLELGHRLRDGGCCDCGR